MMYYGKVYLSNKDIFGIIKDANKIVDALEGLSVESEDYRDLVQSLEWTLDILFDTWRKDFQLHQSKRTGHYFVTFAKQC